MRRSPRRSWSARGCTRGGYRLDANAKGTKRTSEEGEKTVTPVREGGTRERRRRRRRTFNNVQHGSKRVQHRRPVGLHSLRAILGKAAAETREAADDVALAVPSAASCGVDRHSWHAGARAHRPNAGFLRRTSRRSTPGGTTTRSRNASRGCGVFAGSRRLPQGRPGYGLLDTKSRREVTGAAVGAAASAMAKKDAGGARGDGAGVASGGGFVVRGPDGDEIARRWRRRGRGGHSGGDSRQSARCVCRRTKQPPPRRAGTCSAGTAWRAGARRSRSARCAGRRRGRSSW